MFLAISWREQVIFQWDDDEARVVLDQHTYVDFYNDSLPKQQSADRHFAPLRHIILIPSHLVFVISAQYRVLVEKQQLLISQSLIWPNRGYNQRSTTMEANTLTITPLMWSVGFQTHYYAIDKFLMKNTFIMSPNTLWRYQFFNTS